jgi:hypothetical protein
MVICFADAGVESAAAGQLLALRGHVPYCGDTGAFERQRVGGGGMNI